MITSSAWSISAPSPVLFQFTNLSFCMLITLFLIIWKTNSIGASCCEYAGRKKIFHKVFFKYSLTILDLWKGQLSNNSVTFEYPKFVLESTHHANLSKNHKNLFWIDAISCCHSKPATIGENSHNEGYWSNRINILALYVAPFYTPRIVCFASSSNWAFVNID